METWKWCPNRNEPGRTAERNRRNLTRQKMNRSPEKEDVAQEKRKRTQFVTISLFFFCHFFELSLQTKRAIRSESPVRATTDGKPYSSGTDSEAEAEVVKFGNVNLKRNKEWDQLNAKKQAYTMQWIPSTKKFPTIDEQLSCL